MNTEQLATELENIVEEIVSEEIAPEELLKPTAKLKDVIVAVNELSRKIESLGNNPVKVRNRGPKSERVMTDEDAQRIIYGDLMDESHKNAAEILGLSYGQIYSARQGFTFKSVRKDAMLADKANNNPWIHK